MRQIVRAAAAAVILLQAATAQAQLPTVQQVYDKFADAVGGRDAWSKVTGRTEKGTADITFAGISGSMERHQSAPNKMRMIIDLGMARIDQGFDGEKGWADQGQGPQRMPPAMEKSMGEANATGAVFLDPTRYQKASVEAKESFDGKDAYKLAITTKAGEETVEYFEIASGLRIGTVSKGLMGEQKVTYREYLAVDGKKIPSKIVQASPQGDIVLTITSVTFGAPDANLFKAPASIK